MIFSNLLTLIYLFISELDTLPNGVTNVLSITGAIHKILAVHVNLVNAMETLTEALKEVVMLRRENASNVCTTLRARAAKIVLMAILVMLK